MSDANASSAKSTEERVGELLRQSYSEVLDATKHQDDKINRLLTAVSFLTAGSLALANLQSADAVMTAYQFAGNSPDVRLGLIALGAFLVGVVAAVVMLIGSLTTPLRYPGGSKPFVPPVRYVKGPRAGQVYFHEISSIPLVEWYEKWQRMPDDLEAERRDSLIRETHNLAARTEFKYHRTGEAVAVVNFALYSLAIAAVLVLYAAGMAVDSETGYDWRVGGLLALVSISYFGFTFLTSSRNRSLLAGESTLRPDSSRSHRTPTRAEVWNRRWRGLQPIVSAALPAWFFLAPSFDSHPGFALAVCLVLDAAAVAAYCLALPLVSPDVDELNHAEAEALLRGAGVLAGNGLPKRSDERRQTARKEQARTRIGAIVIGVVLALAPIASVVTRQPILYLFGALAAGLTLAGVSVVHSKSSRRSEARDALQPTDPPTDAPGPPAPGQPASA